jgi:hypothetical protein
LIKRNESFIEQFLLQVQKFFSEKTPILTALAVFNLLIAVEHGDGKDARNSPLWVTT